MKLQETFTIPADRTRSWDLLQDIPAVARCLPGAQLEGVDGDTCSGTVKVKLGPIVMTYRGELEVTDLDVDSGRMTIRASGTDRRGAGSVQGSMRVVEAGSATEETTFTVDLDLDLTGKPAQFGRGVIQDVSSRLVAQFARNLASIVTEPIVTEPLTERVGSGEGARALSEAQAPFDALSRPAWGPIVATGGVLGLSVAAWLLVRRSRQGWQLAVVRRQRLTPPGLLDRQEAP